MLFESIPNLAPEAVEHMHCHYIDETSLGLTWTHRSSSVLEYVIEVRQYVRRGEFEGVTVVTEQLYSPFATTATQRLITGLGKQAKGVTFPSCFTQSFIIV